MQHMEKIMLPAAVAGIIHSLEQAGFEAYAVGGCVRDSLLGREPEDWDITTSASPCEVKNLFFHTVDTGIAHGTVTVMWNHVGYEVTTYRLDGEYEDHRHPNSVVFTKELAEDLRRRDFTINAMAYSERTGIVDLFGGREDLANGIIRAVGDAMERFTEDALRMMRAVRFSAQLDFTIEESTLRAVCRLAGDLQRVSAERIRAELSKLLLSEHPDRLLLLAKTGISAVVLPEWDAMLQTPQNNPYHCYNVGIHTLKALEAVQKTKAYVEGDRKLRQILVYTMLLHDVAKPSCYSVDEKGRAHFYGHQKNGAILAKQILKRLKFDNDTVDAVAKLIRHHDSRYTVKLENGDGGLRRLMNQVGVEWMQPLLAVQRGDVYGHKPELWDSMLTQIDLMEARCQSVIEKEQCVSLKQLAVGGKDLLELGYPAGPALGEALNRLLGEVLERPELNCREHLLELARQWCTEILCNENQIQA